MQCLLPTKTFSLHDEHDHKGRGDTDATCVGLVLVIDPGAEVSTITVDKNLSTACDGLVNESLSPVTGSMSAAMDEIGDRLRKQ